MQDIETREDIYGLLERFYTKQYPTSSLANSLPEWQKLICQHTYRSLLIWEMVILNGKPLNSDLNDN